MKIGIKWRNFRKPVKKNILYNRNKNKYIINLSQ